MHAVWVRALCRYTGQKRESLDREPDHVLCIQPSALFQAAGSLGSGAGSPENAPGGGGWEGGKGKGEWVGTQGGGAAGTALSLPGSHSFNSRVRGWQERNFLPTQKACELSESKSGILLKM